MNHSPSYPVRKLLISHEGFWTGLTFTITCPNPFPGSIFLITIFMAKKREKRKQQAVRKLNI